MRNKAGTDTFRTCSGIFSGSRRSTIVIGDELVGTSAVCLKDTIHCDVFLVTHVNESIVELVVLMQDWCEGPTGSKSYTSPHS
jgi:hypothetical protein